MASTHLPPKELKIKTTTGVELRFPLAVDSPYTMSRSADTTSTKFSDDTSFNRRSDTSSTATFNVKMMGKESIKFINDSYHEKATVEKIELYFRHPENPEEDILIYTITDAVIENVEDQDGEPNYKSITVKGTPEEDPSRLEE